MCHNFLKFLFSVRRTPYLLLLVLLALLPLGNCNNVVNFFISWDVCRFFGMSFFVYWRQLYLERFRGIIFSASHWLLPLALRLHRWRVLHLRRHCPHDTLLSNGRPTRGWWCLEIISIALIKNFTGILTKSLLLLRTCIFCKAFAFVLNFTVWNWKYTV